MGLNPFGKPPDYPLTTGSIAATGHHRPAYSGTTTARLRLKTAQDTSMIMDWAYTATLPLTAGSKLLIVIGSTRTEIGWPFFQTSSK
jgi:hypothetical protein